MEILEEFRIRYRQEALDQENEAIKPCKINNKEYKPVILLRGDAAKQLLTGSRYLLYKSPEKK